MTVCAVPHDEYTYKNSKKLTKTKEGEKMNKKISKKRHRFEIICSQYDSDCAVAVYCVVVYGLSIEIEIHGLFTKYREARKKTIKTDYYLYV